jgi:gliding motility-associated-like protein
MKNLLQFVKPLLILCLLSLANSSYAQSNEGTDFWFGFMEHRDVGSNTKVVMITSKFNTSGTISMPLENWNTTFDVSANSVTIITLPSFSEVIGSEQKTELGIHLSSGKPVSVYIHQYHNFRSEATLVLPETSIGTEYYVMSFNGVKTQGNDYPSEFLIVAIEDETLISITVSDFTKLNKAPGTTFNIELDAGETYQVQAREGVNDLTGSHMTGDKNFAVFAGNKWTEVPVACSARDNLLEQMYPVSTWGKKFVTAPNVHMNYGLFRIMAAENNTNITVYGSTTQNYTLNAGEFVQYNKSEASFIESNNPILVCQYIVGSSCNGYSLGDPSMFLLNSIEQTRDTITLYNSSLENISQNFITIIMATDDAPYVTLDGQAIVDNNTIETVGLNNEFAYVNIQVGSGAHTIISEGCGVTAIAYGYGEVESYAYTGGASFNNINYNPIPDGGCLNDTISFDTELSPIRYSFFWDLGDGTTTTEAAFSHFYPQLGTYPVTLIINNECLGTSDTLYKDLKITLREAVETLDDVLICQEETIQLGATDLAGATYEWNGPDAYYSEEQFPIIYEGQPIMSGEYSVVGTLSGCSTFPAFSDVEVIPTPKPELGPDTLFCNNQFQFKLDPGNYSDYLWQDGSSNSFLNITYDGTFSVEVTDAHGCTGEDTVTLREICPTNIYVPNAFSPNDDGINDTFGAFGTDILFMKLTIFNRWGDLLFETNDQKEHWDGKFNGDVLNSGAYVWQLQFEGYRKDGTTYTQTLSGAIYLLN